MNNEEKNIIEENNQPAEKPSIIDFWKKLAVGAKAGIIAALALVIIVPIVLVAALSGGNSNGNEGGTEGGGDVAPATKINYTVTVVDADGVAIKGVKLTFKVAGGSDIPWTTDADGKASHKTDKSVKVTIDTIPAGYTYAKLGAEQSFDSNGALIVTLEKLEVEKFVVRVVDQYGNPVAGVSLQVCNDMNCVPMPKTDENGESSRPVLDGDYAAKISSELPEGYSVDSLDTYYDLVDNEVTITVNKD
ncbi:MAG: Ig-like domain-containing protein [Clostridia bacterium]|nr:Ig-like domain-containing protein [Clostridia bacterium]